MAKRDEKSLNSSTFVEVGSDESDYELDFVTNPKEGPPSGVVKRHDTEEENASGGLTGQISQGVATYVWQEGQQRARKAFSLYANIDILRPYYDVEPHEVRERLFSSLIPRFHLTSDSPVHVPGELYGPTMLVLTLIAMLLFQMKSHEVDVKEGTLMGTAFGTCFGYWFGIAGFLLIVAYICNTHISMIQLLNLLGYALFGHCIVLFVTTVFHPLHSHAFFYFVWLLFGGLASLKMVSVLVSRTPGRMQKMAICAVVVSLHLLFLLYLHFAYHRIVEDLSAAFGNVQHHSMILQRQNLDSAAVEQPATEVSWNAISRGKDSIMINGLKAKRFVMSTTSPVQTVIDHVTNAAAKVVSNRTALVSGQLMSSKVA